MARHGRIDVLVNNAGIPSHKQIYDVTADDVERLMRVNFFACVWTTLAAIPHMLRQGGGAIVNVSSMAAKVAPPRETPTPPPRRRWTASPPGCGTTSPARTSTWRWSFPGRSTPRSGSKDETPSAYTGPKYPPSIVTDAIFEAIEKRRHEMIVPRRSLQLVMARLLRFFAPAAAARHGVDGAGAARGDRASPCARRRDPRRPQRRITVKPRPARGRRSRDEAARTRERILDRAERLFARKGYRAVSTRELAQACGVHPYTIQHHFGSKPKLYEAVLCRWDEPIRALTVRHAATSGSGGTAARGLADTVDAVLDFLLEKSDWVTLNMRSRLGEGLPAGVASADPVWVRFIDALAAAQGFCATPPRQQPAADHDRGHPAPARDVAAAVPGAAGAGPVGPGAAGGGQGAPGGGAGGDRTGPVSRAAAGAARPAGPCDIDRATRPGATSGYRTLSA